MKIVTLNLSNELYEAFERLTCQKLDKRNVTQEEVQTFLENFLQEEYNEVEF